MFNRRRSLAQITAHFNRAIADLEALQGQHGRDHAEVEQKIADLHAQRDSIIAERQQAEVIATNLRALMGQVN